MKTYTSHFECLFKVFAMRLVKDEYISLAIANLLFLSVIVGEKIIACPDCDLAIKVEGNYNEKEATALARIRANII